MKVTDKEQKTIVTFGEVMMRLSTPGFARFTQATALSVTYAGAEANVAVSLAGFGVPARHVTALPDSDLGMAAKQTLRARGVDVNHITFDHHRMGLYFLENGAIHRASKIIYDRFDSAFANLDPRAYNWNEILKDASWFHYTGITPAISQNAAEACLEAVTCAHRIGVTVSGDINYRRNLWQYGKQAKDVMPGLIEKTNILIGGLVDLYNCAGISADSFEEGCARVMDIFPFVKAIATTERKTINASHNLISGFLYTAGDLLCSPQHDLIPIVDRIGTGDAFAAGLIYGLSTGSGYQESLDFATAACAWKHSVEGDFNIAGIAEIRQLMNGEHVGRLLR